MKTFNRYILAAAVAGLSLSANAQDASRTAYFLDGYTFRHQLNPAFSGERNYISIPALGNMYVGTNANIGVNTFLYKMGNGKLTTFMSPTVDANDFLGKLHDDNHLNANVNITLLSAGFKAFGGFNTISIGAKVNAGVSLPKDLFTFMKLGQTGPETHYNFKDLEVKASAVGEIALGHSRAINNKLTVGGKLKFLLGGGNVNAKITDMDVQLNNDKWSVLANGEINMSVGSGLYVPTKQEAGKDYSSPDMADLIDWDGINLDSYGLTGFGLGIDLGATYQLLPDLQLSAAVLDLGFMSWSNTIKGATSNKAWEFDGFRNIALNSDQPGYEDNKLDKQLDNLWDDMQDCVNFHRTADKSSQTKALAATITLGAEYKMPFYKKLTGSFLFTSYIAGVSSWTEGRFAANVKPLKWFDATVSYGASTYGSSFGWMINFHPKGFNFFLGSDHQFFSVTPQFLPVGRANWNLNLGFNVTFGS